ncbi:protein MKS1 [Lotus japonicus]|uniref:protein MKS1 n=1 Tax=Lotus japonicus TaxID=34305 RepID=UPI0025898869|nr:protein MKS1 [Lotus japonicus]
MNPPEFPSGGTSTPSPKKDVQLQGPRPPPLRVSKESHKIRKPPLPPGAYHQPTADPSQHRQPMIIYSVSPKVLHVDVDDFMNVVQRLTGPSTGDNENAPPSGGDISPAARLASIEKTSPSERERAQSQSGNDDDLTWLLEGVEMGQFHGVLSPAPATLPPIPSGFFSPVADTQTTSYWQDMSPYWSANSFVVSPSGLLSAAVVSPLPSPNLFNIFD